MKTIIKAVSVALLIPSALLLATGPAGASAKHKVRATVDTRGAVQPGSQYVGRPCEDDSVSNVASGDQVRVRDARNKVIAVTMMQPGTYVTMPDGGVRCQLHFSVKVPDMNIYTFEFATHEPAPAVGFLVMSGQPPHRPALRESNSSAPSGRSSSRSKRGVRVVVVTV
jgi:hypothetical protein